MSRKKSYAANTHIKRIMKVADDVGFAAIHAHFRPDGTIVLSKALAPESPNDEFKVWEDRL